MTIPAFTDIIEQNDQTAARREHLDRLRELAGNVYPNKFERTKISGAEDTITNLINFAPVAEVVKEITAHVATLAERERPDPELKERLNAKLRELKNVRVSGRMAVPPRVMGKAAFVHLSDGVERIQIYVKRDDVQGVYNGPSAVAADKSEPDSLMVSPNGSEGNDQSPATAGGSDTVDGWEMFGLLDHGDFIGVEGFLFLTNTGELSVHVEKLQFLVKAMVPMPDKMHGIVDPELQRRFRYADLIASSLQIDHEGLTTRQVFERRAKLISGMRRFLDDRGFVEVETPMLTPKATGAVAKPFATHHNALDITLYARIAPELYLKRLTVGGFEKVYELNRNFRNEGLSHKHNPEFTMLEFYCAYMDVNGMMDLCEEMIKESVQKATGGSLQVKYGENEIDFSNFQRLTMKQAIVICSEDSRDYFPERYSADWLEENAKVKALAIYTTARKKEKNTEYVVIPKANYAFKQFDKAVEEDVEKKKEYLQSGAIIPAVQQSSHEERQLVWEHDLKVAELSDISDEESAKNLVTIFENIAEPQLIQPTFIIDYPKSISPLSKASPANPNIAERFELFINGMEVANGFSELNDPKEQYQRFEDQTKERETGDEEAMVMDDDYIRALSYGMPPAAGIGIGIDRLVMLLTNKHSIRDVILFPHMRPEKRDGESD